MKKTFYISQDFLYGPLISELESSMLNDYRTGILTDMWFLVTAAIKYLKTV